MKDNCIRDYLSQVEAKLTCSGREKKLFIRELTADIEEFADSHELSTEALCDRFGTPRELADSFVSQMDAAAIKSKITGKKLAVVAVIVGAAIAIAAIILGVRNYQRREFFSHPQGYIVDTPVYIVDEDQVDEYFEALRQDGAKIY